MFVILVPFLEYCFQWSFWGSGMSLTHSPPRTERHNVAWECTWCCWKQSLGLYFIGVMLWPWGGPAGPPCPLGNSVSLHKQLAAWTEPCGFFASINKLVWFGCSQVTVSAGGSMRESYFIILKLRSWFRKCVLLINLDGSECSMRTPCIGNEPNLLKPTWDQYQSKCLQFVCCVCVIYMVNDWSSAFYCHCFCSDLYLQFFISLFYKQLPEGEPCIC